MGRNALIEAVSGQFQRTHQVVLYGATGIGKTQIALQYCFNHRAKYSFVFWVNAANQVELLSDYKTIAITGGCIYPDHSQGHFKVALG